MTEAEVRKVLEGLKTPTLDRLRENVRQMRTSAILELTTTPSKLIQRLDLSPSPFGNNAQQEQAIVAAALLTLTDEIDRRIPIPK
jgi:hypothetical protein